MKETDIKKIRKIAKSFLYIEPYVPDETFPIIISHPFLSSRYTFMNKEYIDNQIIDLLEADNFKMIAKNLEKDLECMTLESIFYFLNSSYRLTFFKYIKEYLSEVNYAEMLRYAYTSSELPGKDTNVTKRELLTFFKNANKTYLMQKDEREKMKSLNDEIIIFRGTKSDKAIKNISWSLSKKWAKNFENRFYSKGTLYSAKIHKKDIVCYFKGEEEVIIDYNKIYDIKKEN